MNLLPLEVNGRGLIISILTQTKGLSTTVGIVEMPLRTRE